MYYIGTFNDYRRLKNKSRFEEFARISNDLPDDLKTDTNIQDWAFLAPYKSLQLDFINKIKSESVLTDDYLLYLEKIWPSVCYLFGHHQQHDQDVLLLCPEERNKFGLRKILTFFMKSRGCLLIDFDDKLYGINDIEVGD